MKLRSGMDSQLALSKQAEARSTRTRQTRWYGAQDSSCGALRCSLIAQTVRCTVASRMASWRHSRRGAHFGSFRRPCTTGRDSSPPHHRRSAMDR